jgi:3-deoxy-D-manno-octulosonic-acid transferase
MVLFYNLIIRTYYLLVLLFSNFNSKAKLWADGRKGWIDKLTSTIDRNYQTAWFHCASLGEFEQGRPLIEAYKEKHPDHKVLITFFSPSGYEIRKNYKGADYIFYLPLDTRRNAKKFISIVNPIVAIFVKYEFWYHFLNQLKRNNIPTYLVSAIFRPRQVFFQWYGAWNRKMLFCFNQIFIQNSESKSLLSNIKIDNTTVAGDTRFDRVFATSKTAEQLPLLDEFCKDSIIIVAGSTWPKDEELLKSFISNLPQNVKLIIAPHEIDSQRIETFRNAINLPSIRYTEPVQANLAETRVLFLDTIGLLASAYAYGQIAYIGGGFGVGIHNTLEPATFGIPVIFGPNYHRFLEAVELIEIGAAFSVNTDEELIKTLEMLLNNKETLENSGAQAKQYVHQNTGATATILKEL